MSARGALIGCALAASLLGCGHQSECALLVETIAPRLARIRETQPTTPDPPSAAELRATSAAYTDLAAAVDHLELPEGRAGAVAREYQETAVALAAGYEVLARALEGEDAEKLKAARTALDRGGAGERQLMQKLGTLCTVR